MYLYVLAYTYVRLYTLIYTYVHLYTGMNHQENAKRTMLLSDDIYGCLKSRYPLADQLLWIEDQGDGSGNVVSKDGKDAITPNKESILSNNTTTIVVNTNNTSTSASTHGITTVPLNINGSPSFIMSEQFQSMNISTSTSAPTVCTGATVTKEKKSLQFNASLADLIRYVVFLK